LANAIRSKSAAVTPEDSAPAFGSPAIRVEARRVLLLSSLITLPYRVMRCAAAAGAEVYVLGSGSSKGLSYSRHCKQFVANETSVTGERDPRLADKINRCVAEFGIDMVLPGDAAAMRSLLAIQDLVAAPYFPAPTLAQFDYLNNKWNFTNLCKDLNIPCPDSVLVADRAELLAKIEIGRIDFPAIAKPLSLDASQGVFKLEADNARAQAQRISYSPILVQKFISGEDIGASVYCEQGEIKSFIAHRLKRATYETLGDSTIMPTIARIARDQRLNGVFNFDMRRTPDGRIFYLECNPRFFFKINLSMVAGINFVARGLGRTDIPSAVAPGTKVRMPKALVASLLSPWVLGARDLKMLWYFVNDPVSYVRESLGIDWEKWGDGPIEAEASPEHENQATVPDALPARF
jgi:ATP-grasp in the biosynthetic pathway with Ter operon